MTLLRRPRPLLLVLATVVLAVIAGQGCSLSPNVDLPSANQGDGDDVGEGDGDFLPGDGDLSIGDGDTTDHLGGAGGEGCKKSDSTPGGMGGITATNCR